MVIYWLLVGKIETKVVMLHQSSNRGRFGFLGSINFAVDSVCSSSHHVRQNRCSVS